MPVTRNITQSSQSIVVNPAIDTVLSPAPCLIMNNQATGAIINVLLQNDTVSREMYFEAGEIKNLKVVEVKTLNTTSLNILALYD